MYVTVYRFTAISTGTNIRSCAAPAIGRLYKAYLDLLNLRDQAAQVAQETAAVSLGNLFQFGISRGLQLAASFTSVGTELATALPAATAQIPICGATAAATAGQQLNTILANVQSCIIQSG